MKRHITITLTLCSLICLNIQAQLVNCYWGEEKLQYVCKRGEDFDIERLRDTVNLGTIKDNQYLACCYHQLGVYYHNNKSNYVAAIPFYKKSAALRKQNQDGMLWKSYRNMGYAYLEIEFYEKSILYIDSAFLILPELLQDPRPFLNKGNAFAGLGEYNKAIEVAQRSIELVQENFTKYRGEALIAYCMILIEHGTPESLKKAVLIADEAITFYQLINEKGNIAHAYTNKGNALLRLRQYNAALESYQTAEQIYTEIKDTQSLAWTFNNMSIIYQEQNEFKTAIDLLKTALLLKQKYYNNTSREYTYASTYENLADNYVGLKDYPKGIEYYNTALDNLKDNPKSDTPYIYNKPDLLRVLDLKAQAALKNGDIDLAHNTYQELDDWINEFYKDLSTNQSKLTWIARAHTTYGHAIEVALAKNDKEKAFQYAEKAHAVLLWQSLSRQAARNLLSEADKEKMDDLNAQIRQANEQYRYGEITLDTLRKLERERDNLEAKFDKKYPDYAQRKYQVETTSISDIQANITDEHTAFIEYYRTDETLYIFTITKNGIQITQENAAGLANGITDFVKNISSESRTETALLTSNTNTITRGGNINPQNFNLDSYHKAAHKLYQQLIPATVHSNEKINRLIIVPDREIGMLPFTALTTQATSGNLNKNTPFLIKKYSINYLYSAGSYLQLQQKTANQKYCFAGIAPVEYQVENSEKLIYSEEELNKIKTLHWQWNREILMREQATKAAFERIVKQGYRTIQVSTHAVFDEQGGRIIFHDKIITQDEIDQLEINTHRLILSACETGVGTQNQGEGILSLGWNFAYKGVPSITMTHWSVNDNSTKNIMIEYHQNLHDGLPADQALRAAQITYLNDHTPSKKAFSPYYWAGIFHTGNVR